MERKKDVKSLGIVKPEDILKKSGADILRLWVATTDYTEDMRISEEILSNMHDYYRKVRNSFRFILGNVSNEKLNDYLNYDSLRELDSIYWQNL